MNKIPLKRVNKVRLNVGRVVTRVGYPMGIREAEAAIGVEKLAAAVRSALSEAGIQTGSGAFQTALNGPATHRPRWLRELTGAICYRYARQHHFGGSSRQLIYEERPELVGETFRVYALNTRWAAVGTRFPGSAAYSTPNGYSEAEPPEFELDRMVGLLEVSTTMLRTIHDGPEWLCLDDVTVIEALPHPRAIDQRMLVCSCPNDVASCRIHTVREKLHRSRA